LCGVKQGLGRRDVDRCYDVIMTRRNNRKSTPSRCIRASILLAGLSLLLVSATAETLTATGRRRRTAGPASSSSASVASRESVLECFVVEELYVGTDVVNIVTKYGLDRRYTPSELQQLRFGFLAQSTPSGMQIV